MAKLILQVESSGLTATTDKVKELRDELKSLTGIEYDGTNSKEIADALLAREKQIADRREAVQQSLQEKLKIIEAKADADSRLIAEKRIVTEQQLNARLEAARQISQDKIAAQNERFYAKESRLQQNQANSLFAKFGNVRDVLGSITKAAIASGTAITSALTVTSFINLNKSLDSTRARIKGLFDKDEAGLSSFDATVKAVTDNASLGFKSIQEAATQLKTLGLEPTTKTLQTLVDATAKVGGSSETLDGIVRALTQSLNKGTIQQEELNQLAERGIPAQKLLAEAMGVTGAELASMQQKGQLGRKEIELLITAIGNFSSGASADQINTIGGAFTKLTDNVQTAARAIGEGGINKALVDIAKDIATTVKSAQESGTLKELGANIATGLKVAYDSLKTFGVLVKENINTIKLLGEAFLIGKSVSVFSSGISTVLSLFTKFTSVASVATSAVTSVGTSVLSLGGILTRLGGFATAFNPITLAITAVGGAIAYFNSTLDDYKAKQESANRASTIDKKLKEISDITGITVNSMKELNEQMDAGNIIFDEATGKYSNAVVVLTELNSTAASADFSKYSELGEKADAALASITKLMDGGITGSIRMQDAIARVSNNELASLKAAFEDALNTGIIKSDEFSKALNLINIEGINRQFEILGIKSSAELQRVADESKIAFDKIAQSGASVRDIASAFEVYANRAIEANAKANPEKAGVLESQLKVLAAQNKLNVEISATGTVSAKAYNDLSASADKAGVKISEVDDKQAKLNAGLREQMRVALQNDIEFQNQLDSVFADSSSKRVEATRASIDAENELTSATESRLEAEQKANDTARATASTDLPKPVQPIAPTQVIEQPKAVAQVFKSTTIAAQEITAPIIINIDGKKIFEEIRRIALQRK